MKMRNGVCEMVNPHLPQPDTLRCQQISIEPDLITITIESMAPQGICPLCGRSSSREHSRYTGSIQNQLNLPTGSDV